MPYESDPKDEPEQEPKKPNHLSNWAIAIMIAIVLMGVFVPLM